MGRWSELYDLQPDPWDPKTPTERLRVCLFRDVKNAVELRELLAKGDIDCAIVKAELILELFQLMAAANRAIHSRAHGKMATKGIHSEIVYSLSPSRNISESLQTFGISDNSVNILVAVHGDVKGDKMTKIGKKVEGRPTSLNQLKNISNYDLVKKVYHVKDPEINKATITDAIVTRIVAKDYVA